MIAMEPHKVRSLDLDKRLLLSVMDTEHLKLQSLVELVEVEVGHLLDLPDLLTMEEVVEEVDHLDLLTMEEEVVDLQMEEVWDSAFLSFPNLTLVAFWEN